MKSRTLAPLAALALLATGPALAGNTDSKDVDVTGTIITALELAVVNNLTMPDVVAPSTGEETVVTYSRTGSVSYAGGDGDPGALNGNDSEQLAELTATGEEDYTFSIDAVANDDFDAGVTFEPDCPATGTVGDSFNCGGTVTVTDEAATGAYSGTFSVTVTYN